MVVLFSWFHLNYSVKMSCSYVLFSTQMHHGVQMHTCEGCSQPLKCLQNYAIWLTSNINIYIKISLLYSSTWFRLGLMEKRVPLLSTQMWKNKMRQSFRYLVWHVPLIFMWPSYFYIYFLALKMADMKFGPEW